MMRRAAFGVATVAARMLAERTGGVPGRRVTLLVDFLADTHDEIGFKTLLRWVDEAQAHKIVQNRGVWLDVRLPSEFQNLAVEGSMPASATITSASRSAARYRIGSVTNRCLKDGFSSLSELR